MTIGGLRDPAETLNVGTPAGAEGGVRIGLRAFADEMWSTERHELGARRAYGAKLAHGIDPVFAHRSRASVDWVARRRIGVHLHAALVLQAEKYMFLDPSAEELPNDVDGQPDRQHRAKHRQK